MKVRDKTTGRFVKQEWQEGIEISPMWGLAENLAIWRKTENEPPLPMTPNDRHDFWLHVVGYVAYLGLIAIISAVSAYIGAHWR